MRKRRWLASSALVASAIALGAHAQPADPLAAVHDTDPLVLAHAVDRLGDEAVLARLAPETPIAVRSLAVLAAARLHAPEAALVPLAEIAAGRDPTLAPRAASAILAIARGLDERGLDAREVERAELGPARAALGAVAADETARPDVRLALRLADAALADLAIPAE